MKTHIFSVFELHQLLRPCVYTIWRGTERLYIGSSASGISRIFDRSHPAIKRALREGMDNLTFEFHDSPEMIRQSEAEQIEAHRPLWNRRVICQKARRQEVLDLLAAGVPVTAVAEKFGISKQRVRQIKMREIRPGFYGKRRTAR